MIRPSIQIITHKKARTIFTKELQITFASSGKRVKLFTTLKFTMPMLDDLEKSRIVQVERSLYSDEIGWIEMNRLFGYSDENFTKVLLSIIDKYNLCP